MGYMAHDAVIAVISEYDHETIERIERFRQEMRDNQHVEDQIHNTDFNDFLVGPVVGINGYHMYAFLPDGSKEGWGTSDRAHLWREKFADIARGQRYDDGSGSGEVVAVRFGGDFGHEQGTTVTFSTDGQPAALRS
jgi:hypothetical protein